MAMNDDDIQVEIVDDGSTLPGEEEPELDTLMGIEVLISEDDDEFEEEEETEADEDGFNENLAEVLDDSVLASIATDLIDEFQADVDSRKDWVQTYTDGLELLGLKIEMRAEPWEVLAVFTTH